jgi:hypothetical protein
MSTLSFAPGYAEATYRLFEVDESVLQELLRNDGR